LTSTSDGRGDNESTGSSRLRLLRRPEYLVHCGVLFAFWYVLSGSSKPFYLALGLLSAAAVAALTYEMQFTEQAHAHHRSMHFFALPWFRLTRYSHWLFKEIVLANWAVLKVVLDPRLPADPELLRYRTRLESSFGRTLLANSITLTPGTITVDIDGDDFVVHALVGGEGAVAGIAAIEKQIARALVGIEASPGEPR
jgi:multicomponent Na+:H+ antiporter subunit E